MKPTDKCTEYFFCVNLLFLRHINDSLVGFYLACEFTWTIHFNSSFVLGKKKIGVWLFAAMPTLYIEALFMIVVQSWLPVTSDAMSLTFSSSHICTETVKSFYQQATLLEEI